MKKWICIASAVVLLAAVWAVADSGRETLRNPPQEIEMLSEYSSLETWAHRVKNSSGNVVSQIDDEGHNSYRDSALTWTVGTGFQFGSQGSWYTFDVTSIANSNILTAVGTAGAGVTVILPTVTADNDGEIYPLHKIDSGTTVAVLYAGGQTINSASGTTTADMDALGDIIHLKADYNSAVSYWIVNRYIH